MKNITALRAALLAALTRPRSRTDAVRSVLSILKDWHPTPASVWVARTNNAKPSQAQLLLSFKNQWLVRDDNTNWAAEVRRSLGGRDPKPRSIVQCASGWYCLSDAVFSLSPEARDILDLTLAHTLRDFAGDVGAQFLDHTLTEFRQRLTDVDKPRLGLMSFEHLFAQAAGALTRTFPDAPILLAALPVGSWRRQRRGRSRAPRTHWHGFNHLNTGQRRRAIAALRASMFGNRAPVRCSNTPTDAAVGQPHELASVFGETVRVLAIALYLPQQIAPDDGVPFIAALTPADALSPRARETLGHYLVALRDLVRARDIAEHAELEEELEKKIHAIRQPEDAAKAVVTFLAERYGATEVAVLERRGNFLSVIAKYNINFDDVPPIYIPSRTGLVSLVAETNKSRYDPDVSGLKTYLPVVADTRAQYTLPVTWRAANVGVMLVGFGVLDPLWAHDRDSISTLAGRCAESISALRSDAERRAVLHALKDNLPIVREQIGLAKAGVSGDAAKVLESARTLVSKCLEFIADYARTESGIASSPTSGSLAKIIREALADQSLSAWLEQKAVKVVFKPDSGDIIVDTNDDALAVAFRHVVTNAVEAIVEKREAGGNAAASRRTPPGSVRVRLKRENLQNPALRRAIAFGVIEIEDDGVGIPREMQDRVFEFGYSTKEGRSHLGGGLSLAKRGMEGFGGRITFESDKARTVFRLFVPAHVN